MQFLHLLKLHLLGAAIVFIFSFFFLRLNKEFKKQNTNWVYSRCRMV